MPSQPSYQDLEQKIQQLEADLARLKQEKIETEKQTLIYKNLFTHSPFEIHVWQIIRNNSGKIQNWKLVDANPKALKLWGKSLVDILGQTTDVIFPDANPIETFMPTVERIFSAQAPLSWEQYFSGTDQTLRMISIPFDDYFISTGIDVSDLKRIEKELRIKTQAAESANSAKSQFLANMSHEMRTPLNAIIGFSQILLMNSKSIDSTSTKHITNIKTSGDVLLGLIDNILDFSKIESGTIDISDDEIKIKDYVERIMLVTKISCQEKSVTLDVLIDPTLPTSIHSDIGMLDRITINLISNAVKFSPDGSRVQFILKRNQNNMLIEVRDEGIGIEKAHLGKIFNDFEQADNSATRAYGGTGLGLAIVKRMTEALGGKITVDSTPGSGSTFCASIPIDQEQPVASPEPNKPVAHTLKSKAVLIAEDDDMNRQVIGSMLEPLGIDAVFAHNGQEAVEKARQMIATNNLGFILLDIHMPIMDGITAAKHLRADEQFSKTPIIAVSADVFAKQKQKAFDAGFDDYLTKPLALDTLTSAIKKHMNL